MKHEFANYKLYKFIRASLSNDLYRNEFFLLNIIEYIFRTCSDKYYIANSSLRVSRDLVIPRLKLASPQTEINQRPQEN